jgi:hypothetical protein
MTEDELLRAYGVNLAPADPQPRDDDRYSIDDVPEPLSLGELATLSRIRARLSVDDALAAEDLALELGL